MSGHCRDAVRSPAIARWPRRAAASAAVVVWAAAALSSAFAQAPPAPSAPASEEARRTIRYHREDEDWRWLAAGSRLKDAFDPLKNMPLAGKASLGLGADLRMYFESYRNEGFGTGLPANDYLQTRALLHGDLRFGDHLRLFTQFEHADVPGRDGGPRRVIDRNDFDFNQLFVEASIAGAQLRLGRQELRLGSARIVSTRDGFLNTRQPLDGARLILRRPWGRTDLFLFHQVAVAPGAFDDRAKGQPWLWGAQFAPTQKAPTLPAWEFYALGYDSRRSTYFEGTGNERRRTLGTRLALNRSGWDHDIEANYQFGEFRDGPIRAWAANWESGYTFRAPRWRPRLGWALTMNSGDRRAGDGRLETYRPFVSRGPWGQVVPFGYSNVEGLQLVAGLQPRPTLRLALRHYMTRRHSLGDGLYSGGYLPLRPGTPAQSRNLGSQSELFGEWDIDRHLRITLAYDHVEAGRFIRQGPGKRDTRYGALVLLYRF